MNSLFRRIAFATVALLFPLSVRAGEDVSKSSPPPAPAPVEPTHEPFKLSGEFALQESYIGDSEVRREGRDTTLDEHSTLLRFVLTPRTPIGYLRLGAEWERYSFGFSTNNAPLPNTLQAISLVLGLDTRLSESILVRAEVQPGLYGTGFRHVRSGDFNAPFVLGGTYFFNPDFQLVLGVSVNVNRKYPVLGGGGVRWKFAPRLVANAVLPTPRLEYELNSTLSFYAGAELKENTFRVDDHFGDTHGDPRLNRAVLTYSEVRVGAGVNWKVTPTITLNAEAGYLPYREFDFYRADARYHHESGAPYGAVALRGTF